jgi:hypothetical protein
MRQISVEKKQKNATDLKQVETNNKQIKQTNKNFVLKMSQFMRCIL